MVRLLPITLTNLSYLTFVRQLFLSRAVFVTYAECNGEIIMYSASTINPTCNTLFGIIAPWCVRGRDDKSGTSARSGLFCDWNTDFEPLLRTSDFLAYFPLA